MSNDVEKVVAVTNSVNITQSILSGAVTLLTAAAIGGATWMFGFFRETREANRKANERMTQLEALTDKRITLLEQSSLAAVQAHAQCAKSVQDAVERTEHTLRELLQRSEQHIQDAITTLFRKIEHQEETTQELAESTARLSATVDVLRGQMKDTP